MIELSVKNAGLIELQAIPGGERGDLFVAEVWKQIPFPIRRVFYTKGMKYEALRGGHAHRESRQALFCASGSCWVRLDDGENKQSLILDSPGSGLLVEPLLWHELTDFSPDCFVLVFANNRYDEADYIRDYQEFLRLAAGEQEVAGR
ncbi:MAG: FdtA/QdtA family cupin domain-containing protein [Parcubacteria group bacterium]|nr:FdtA/QdtA family cupin domain-containing protein [Parcubacteria group bacterium]